MDYFKDRDVANPNRSRSGSSPVQNGGTMVKVGQKGDQNKTYLIRVRPRSGSNDKKRACKSCINNLGDRAE